MQLVMLGILVSTVFALDISYGLANNLKVMRERKRELEWREEGWRVSLSGLVRKVCRSPWGRRRRTWRKLEVDYGCEY